MRRLVPASIIVIALLAGCGSDSPSASSSSAAPGSGSPGTGAPSSSAPASSAPAEAATKPSVQIPAELPTELVITDLVDGDGPAAKVGDTVEVNYVGVRSADGTEFDNSYDRGSTFPVTLGANTVIQGWEQGLIGIKAGGRRQLDIPAELAYGDSPPGSDVIQPGDALTFVIDAVSVTVGVDVPAANPADKPVVEIAPTSGTTELQITDLVDGDGDTAAAGQTVYIQVTAYRGDTAAELNSTWDAGEAAKYTLDDTTLPGLVKGIIGMKVGGRRLIVVPPADAFGDTGNSAIGLDAGVDLILVVDLVALTG
jgi:peptidylprolyl isomerase